MTEDLERDRPGSRQDIFDSLSFEGDREGRNLQSQSDSASLGTDIVGQDGVSVQNNIHARIREAGISAPPSSTVQSIESTNSPQSEEPINLSQLLDRCEGDVELLTEVRRTFSDTLSALLATTPHPSHQLLQRPLPHSSCAFPHPLTATTP
jgi:hypothetical protein